MSAKIGVLKAGQSVSAQPYRWVKKCVAKLLLRRLEADRISDFLIQERVIRECQLIGPRLTVNPLPLLPRQPYIPEVLPPIEVPNCYFEPPESAASLVAWNFLTAAEPA